MSRVAFWATVCKTVRHMLSGSYLSWLSVCPDLYVCNVGVFWPNGWMDQDATWYGGRSRPRPHCGRWRPISPRSKKEGAFFCPSLSWPKGWIDQDATWYKGTPRPRPHCVTWGSSAPPREKGHSPQFSAYAYCDQTVAHLSCCWALD